MDYYTSAQLKILPLDTCEDFITEYKIIKIWIFLIVIVEKEFLIIRYQV
jgi:hypothetical protein